VTSHLSALSAGIIALGLYHSCLSCSTRGYVKTARDLLTSEIGASGVNLVTSTSEVTASVGRPRQLSPTAAALLSRYLRSRNVVGLSATAPASLSLSKVVAAEKLKTQLKSLKKPPQGEFFSFVMV